MRIQQKCVGKLSDAPVYTNELQTSKKTMTTKIQARTQLFFELTVCKSVFRFVLLRFKKDFRLIQLILQIENKKSNSKKVGTTNHFK